MAEIVNGLNKIEQITLGEAVFGNGLNERLEQIDDNFQSIITSEYLKGDSGTSFGYATFSNKLEFVNPTQIYHITTNNEEVLDVDGIKNSLTTVIGKDVGEFEFTFIYEIINGKKIAKSSLPFVYYDPSIYGISQDLEQGDCSCIVIFDGEFKKLNAFPTIYYNKEDDKFYWKINGIETKLTATGPKGERGLAGAFNIVFVRKDEENEGGENECKYIIEKFLYQDPKTHGYSWIVIDANMPEEDKRIAEDVLRPGSPCIALWGEGVETVNEETGENEITSIIVVGPIILQEEENNSIYYVQVWDHMSIQHNMNASLLVDILNNIDPQGVLKGLYVPTVDKQHNYLLHTDNDDVLNISYTDNQFNPEDDGKVRIPKLLCNDIDFNGVRLMADSGTGDLNIISSNRAIKINNVDISYNNLCNGFLQADDFTFVGNINLKNGPKSVTINNGHIKTKDHIQLGGKIPDHDIDTQFKIKDSKIIMEDSNINIKGKGDSNVDLIFTEGQARVSDSNIFSINNQIDIDRDTINVGSSNINLTNTQINDLLSINKSNAFQVDVESTKYLKLKGTNTILEGTNGTTIESNGDVNLTTGANKTIALTGGTVTLSSPCIIQNSSGAKVEITPISGILINSGAAGAQVVQIDCNGITISGGLQGVSKTGTITWDKLLTVCSEEQ